MFVISSRCTSFLNWYKMICKLLNILISVVWILGNETWKISKQNIIYIKKIRTVICILHPPEGIHARVMNFEKFVRHFFYFFYFRYFPVREMYIQTSGFLHLLHHHHPRFIRHGGHITSIQVNLKKNTFSSKIS